MTDAARESAYHGLLDALACAFQALQHADCTRVLGPVVPGATMTFGARVPGTSLQLDPVQAAFNLGTMIGWLDQQDASLTTRDRHLADPLGAVLSVADYLARKALAEGRAPATVREVLDTLLDADAASPAMTEWSPLATAGSHDRGDRARIASAAASASMFGANPTQVAVARRLAARESGVQDVRAPRPSWWLGEANARGVRIALLAKAGPANGGDPVPDAPMSTASTASLLQPGAVAVDQANATPLLDDTATARIRDRFVASVTAHFPPVQGEKIRAAFLDRPRLEAMAINELVSLTVRN